MQPVWFDTFKPPTVNAAALSSECQGLLFSDLSTIVCPLEKRLSLPAPTTQIAGLTILSDLTYVAPHRFPSFDLSRIFLTHAAAEVITAIPLKPSARVVGVYPPLRAPNR